MPIIQQQLGHASLKSTDTYLAHIAPRQVIETMRERDWIPRSMAAKSLSPSTGCRLITDRRGLARRLDCVSGAQHGGRDEIAKSRVDKSLEPALLMPYGGSVQTKMLQPGFNRDRVSANKGKTYPVEILTPDEVRALAAQCSEVSSSGIRHRALIVLLYRTGLRISEALALRVKDIDFDLGSVAVLHGSGGRRRTVGIDPGANVHIEAWIDRRRMLGVSDPAPLFCTLRGGVLNRTAVSETLHRLAHKAGIEKRVHPHGFRHTHAYELMMEGIAMPIIQQQLGHASLATTSIYLSHIAPKDVIETMGRREWSP